MADAILVLNAGSSSVKFSVFLARAGALELLLRGQIEALFTKPRFEAKDPAGNKLEAKRYWRHSGYPGGIKSRTLGDLLEQRPEEVIRRAVKGMLPRNRLARQQLRKLKVYAGPEHPHQAQKPEQLEMKT
jgi:hypothetical protein